MIKKIIFVVVVVFVVLGANFFLKRVTQTPASVFAFAACLRNQGVTMYGAEWCSHCEKEKRAFGNAFQEVRYVECVREPQRCLQEGIEAFPTWILPSGERLVGEQGLQKLSIATGCPLFVK